MNAQTIYSTAFKQYKKGNYAAALELLNTLMEAERGAKIYALLAKVLVQLGLKSDAAWAYHLAGQEEGPRSDHYLTEAMKLHFACGNEDEALSLGKPKPSPPCAPPPSASACRSSSGCTGTPTSHS